VRGWQFALNDIGLAVFTTLAPAAALAYVVLACVILLGNLNDRERRCAESWLIVPLAVAAVGLIASATHLGTPSNVLYVFVRVGASPLSTEVFWTIAFLGCSSLYWLACIYIGNLRSLKNLWLTASVVLSFAFLRSTSHAYAFPTVVSWNTPFAPIELCLCGIAAMAPLATFVLVCAGQGCKHRLVRCLELISAIAGLAACLCMLLQYVDLGTMHNAYGTAQDLVPLYPVAVAVFGVCCIAAVTATHRATSCLWQSLKSGGQATCATTAPEQTAQRRLLIACAIAYFGVFAVRVFFYCFHMTEGVV
jgi:anaerobic dimethyl sulfoxide reductase subunit C (anchor subunit)